METTNIIRNHFIINMADLNIELDTVSPRTCILCRNYLSEGKPDVKIKVTKKDIERERKKCVSPEKKEIFIEDINRVLTEENAGYRIVGQEVAPIINEEEIKEIEKTIFSPYEPVEKHMKKALSLYSDRKTPDYENSIKESISAVEAICCIITNSQRGQATLGAALKRLKDNGVYIHKAMISAFENLYGYTSDQNGIRHGGIDFVNATEEDARYMLISCSAFINYLTAKM